MVLVNVVTYRNHLMLESNINRAQCSVDGGLAHLGGPRKTVASGVDAAPRNAALLVQSEARRCKICPHSRFFEVPASVDTFYINLFRPDTAPMPA